MKTMTLTGLGSEQNFKTGGASYFLVFNSGELRVPISEEAAEVVIKGMYNGQEEPPEKDESQDYASSPDGQTEDLGQEDDDGVGQI